MQRWKSSGQVERWKVGERQRGEDWVEGGTTVPSISGGWAFGKGEKEERIKKGH